MTLFVVALLIPYMQSVPDVEILRVSLPSLLFLFLPSLFTVLVTLASGAAPCLVAIASVCGVGLSTAIAAYGGWVDVASFTHPITRTIVVLAALLPTAFFLSQRKSASKYFTQSWSAGVVVGGGAALLLAPYAISQITFDESHGMWETTLASFQPEDFGRSHYYTYSLLYAYADTIVGARRYMSEAETLPPLGEVFVLKMPTKPLNRDFAERVVDWVRSGGRLLVVGDHTDLYDSAQNLNPMLRAVGAEIREDAIYDRSGMPNVPGTCRCDVVRASLIAAGSAFPWQTGASLKRQPIGGLALATFGPSFSESADYSRPNRFGLFWPQLSFRFLDHSAVVGWGVGDGLVIVVLDSTPWSNFSFFKEQYKALFRAILGTFENSRALVTAGWGAIGLFGILLLLPMSGSRVLIFVAGAVFGLTLVCSTRVGMASLQAPVHTRDFGVRVVLGHMAHTQFLKQLIPVGERNYSRALSSLYKYGHTPTTLDTMSRANLTSGSNWLFIEPDPQQLPRASDVYKHLRRAGSLHVLFGPDSAQNADVRVWLANLGLGVRRSVGMALVEDHGRASESLLTRQPAQLLRDVRSVTYAFPTSLLKPATSYAIVQSYTIRPTKLPRESGVLSLSFAADQFADDAMGEVWEGLRTTSLGRIREEQLSAIVAGEDSAIADHRIGHPLPTEWVQNGQPGAKTLKHYIVLKDGAVLLEGVLPTTLNDEDRNELPGYLSALRGTAYTFVRASCAGPDNITTCNRRLLGHDLIEWEVLRRQDRHGVAAIELLHERRFSGLGATYNIVFSR